MQWYHSIEWVKICVILGFLENRSAHRLMVLVSFAKKFLVAFETVFAKTLFIVFPQFSAHNLRQSNNTKSNTHNNTNKHPPPPHKTPSLKKMMYGMPQEPLPPKRKAEKEMKSKLSMFIVGCIVLRLAPYISTQVAEGVSALWKRG